MKNPKGDLELDLHRFFHAVKSEHKSGSRPPSDQFPPSLTTHGRYRSFIFTDSLCSDNDVVAAIAIAAAKVASYYPKNKRWR